MMTGPQMIIIIFIFRHHLAVAQITEKHVTRPFLQFFLQKEISYCSHSVASIDT